MMAIVKMMQMMMMVVDANTVSVQRLVGHGPLAGPVIGYGLGGGRCGDGGHTVLGTLRSLNRQLYVIAL